MQREFITVGVVVNAHGVRGEVKVHPIDVEPAVLASFSTLYLDGEPLAVRGVRVHKNAVLLKLPGVEDMDAALALKGRELSVRRADAALPEGTYFDAELVGLTVVDEATGETLGELTRVLAYPAHKVYEVRGGGREYLIPAVPGVFVAGVDLAGGVMSIHRMKGLASDEN